MRGMRVNVLSARAFSTITLKLVSGFPQVRDAGLTERVLAASPR